MFEVKKKKLKTQSKNIAGKTYHTDDTQLLNILSINNKFLKIE